MATTTPDDVLTLYEASQLLKVSEKTLANESKAGNVPHFKIGRQFRFHKQKLLAWTAAETQTISDAEFNAELSAMVNRSMAKQAEAVHSLSHFQTRKRDHGIFNGIGRTAAGSLQRPVCWS